MNACVYREIACKHIRHICMISRLCVYMFMCAWIYVLYMGVVTAGVWVPDPAGVGYQYKVAGH